MVVGLTRVERLIGDTQAYKTVDNTIIECKTYMGGTRPGKLVRFVQSARDSRYMYN